MRLKDGKWSDHGKRQSLLLLNAAHHHNTILQNAWSTNSCTPQTIKTFNKKTNVYFYMFRLVIVVKTSLCLNEDNNYVEREKMEDKKKRGKLFSKDKIKLGTIDILLFLSNELLRRRHFADGLQRLLDDLDQSSFLVLDDLF